MRSPWVALFFAAACASTQPAAKEADEVRHVFLASGHQTGAQTVTRGADGSLVIRFHFADRGRGPDVTTKIWLEGSIPQRIESRGVDYYKVAVNEDFVIQNNTARWKNASEDSSATISGPAFYLGMNTPPEEVALLVRAALKSADRRIAVLPSGTVQVAVIGSHEVHRGEEKKSVTLYSISGIDFTPYYVWLDEELNLFATVSGWSSLIAEGWEQNAEPLLNYQKNVDRAHLEGLAKSLAKRPGKPVAFQNVAVFDTRAAKIVAAQTVLVSDDKITAVGPAATIKIPDGAEVIDGRGRTLLPGLWDMHVHLGDFDGLLHVAAGVTSVRDLGNHTDQLLETKRAFDSGMLIGPRITFSGFIDGPGEFSLKIGKVVENEQQMREAVDHFANQGAEQIKLYSSLDPKLVPVAIDHANKRGMRISGHVPQGMHASDFIEQGAHELQHANFLILNFIDGPDTRTPERFHAVGREASDLELASPKVKAFIELLKNKRAVVDPTLVTFESMFTQRPGEITPSVAPVFERLPINVQRGSRRGGLAPPGMEERYQTAYARMMAMVAELYRQGVQVVVGTDEGIGFALHRELELYVKAGIPAAEVLKMCTLGAAQVMKRGDKFGVIAPERAADLYLVEGDPTQKIEDIRRGVWTMKGGVLYRPEDVYAAIGVQRTRKAALTLE